MIIFSSFFYDDGGDDDDGVFSFFFPFCLLYRFAASWFEPINQSHRMTVVNLKPKLLLFYSF